MRMHEGAEWGSEVDAGAPWERAHKRGNESCAENLEMEDDAFGVAREGRRDWADGTGL